MCGIVGLIAFDAPLERSTDLVKAMAERIAHRGPDGGGVTAHPDATLGMKRLAIVDVEHGQQPMFAADGQLAIVFNGEIYNAPNLRRGLVERGVRFHTRSDTEVILRLYEQNPDDVERHLAGMWTFAIHDRRRRRVTLSRDRFGIKPLFVVDTGSALAFASELRAFDRDLRPFSSHFTLDHGAAHAMVSWGYVPETGTIYKGVQRLAPATRLDIDLATGRRTTTTHYQLTPSAESARIATLDDACVVVEEALRRSVREHLESDVPIATFLSGGIDSSLITALAHEESGGRVKAYAIGFHDPRFDESPFARETAAKIGLPIEVQRLDELRAREQLADALLAYDEPFGDSSSLATYLVSKHVGRDFKVALGGDGGDEVFAGYTKYEIINIRRHLSRVPSVRDEIGRALGRLPSRTDRTSGWSDLLRLVRKLSRGLSGADDAVYADLGQVGPLAKTAVLMRKPLGADKFVEAARARFRGTRGSELQRYLISDIASPLPNDMLVKVDRASMANRLEARVPFLDHRVVELGIGLPEQFVLKPGKRVLRTLHERRFGRALANRKKQGFGVPVERWLRGNFDRACEQLFDRQRLDQFELLSAEALSHGRFRAWAANDPMVLWHAFALAAWCEVTHGIGPDGLRAVLGSAS